MAIAAEDFDMALFQSELIGKEEFFDGDTVEPGD
jgi:hypothetical protein